MLTFVAGKITDQYYIKRDICLTQQFMLRTNPAFVNFIERYIAGQQEGKHIAQKTFKPGTRIIRQGSTIHQVYIITDGIVKCFISEDNGKDYIFEFLGTGEVTGDLEAINKATCLCNIDAITTVAAYVIPHSLFTHLLQNNQQFNTLMMQELATRIRQTCIRASYQQLYPVEYALQRLLTLEAQQDIRLSKKDMADYLGISVRSFNRTLKELKEKNYELGM
jgi:CRP-like cAMP-binding protein